MAESEDALGSEYKLQSGFTRPPVTVKFQNNVLITLGIGRTIFYLHLPLEEIKKIRSET